MSTDNMMIFIGPRSPFLSSHSDPIVLLGGIVLLDFPTNNGNTWKLGQHLSSESFGDRLRIMGFGACFGLGWTLVDEERKVIRAGWLEDCFVRAEKIVAATEHITDAFSPLTLAARPFLADVLIGECGAIRFWDGSGVVV